MASSGTRTETDAFGPVEVQNDRYWGAQTQRSLGNFNINLPQEKMPEGVVRAFGILKGAAATVNMKYGLGELLQSDKFDAPGLTMTRPQARPGHPTSSL
jgi:fumarate hydratase class II